MREKKVILLFSAIIFCSLLCSTGISLFSINKISYAYITEFLTSLSDNINRSIDKEVAEKIHVSKTIANDSFLIDLLQNEDKIDQSVVNDKMASYASRISDIFSDVWVFVVSDKSKSYYTNNGILIIDPENNPEDKWYTDFINMDKEYDVIIGMDNDVEDGWNIFVDVGIKSESGELLGVGGIAWEMSNLQELVKNYEDKYNMEIFFADETGKIIIKNGSMEEYEKDFSLPAEADKEKIVVSKTGIKSNYMVTQYIESLECYMIIRDLDPYDYTFKHILIILNIATFITFVLITLICLYHVVKRNKILFRSSYVDELTGMLNRRAFEDKIGKIRKKGHPENIKVAAFDVNGLKVSNDTLGHTAGDELISGAADVIRETFDSYGKCYRTGGDEFVAVLDKSVEDTDELAERFEKAVSEWHGTQVEKMSVSYGIISSDDDENISIDDMLVSADEEMYRNKRKYYSVNENNRRKA